jgi:glycyl-tRNA synthetase beta subunit
MQKDSNQIKEKYMPRFNKILPAKTVMRFYQIENKMDTIVMLAVASQIPLAK